MMNWIPRAIAILSVAAAVCGLSPLVSAQVSQRQEAQAQSSVTNETAPDTNSPLRNQPDLGLLAKTVTNFLKSERYQTESELQLSAATGGTTISSSVQVTTIVQSPKRFRSEITFASTGSSVGKKYLVVSNGNQVWIYRLDLKQYAVTDYASFDKSQDTYLLGLSTMFFLEMAPELKKMGAQGNVSEPEIQEALALILQSQKIAIKGGQRNIQGKEYYAYEYTDPKEGFTINAFVVPETATVDQLQISGQSDGMDIMLKEKIIRRVENPAITADTFSFSPPQGVKKVESIRLESF